MHRRARESRHARALRALPDRGGHGRGGHRRGRRAHPLLRLLPRQGARSRLAGAAHHGGLRRQGAGQYGRSPDAPRRGAQERQSHSRRRVPSARRGRGGHALHPALEPAGSRR